MRLQKGHFIEQPSNFSVTVPSLEGKIDIEPTGLYLTYNYKSVWINYAGEQAGDSYAKMEIPSDPKFLRKLSREINNFAKRLDEERSKL